MIIDIDSEDLRKLKKRLKALEDALMAIRELINGILEK